MSNRPGISNANPTSANHCPPPEALACAVAQAAGAGADDEALHTHLRGCVACATAWQQQHELRALGARLPFVPPSAERRQKLRDDLLATVAGQRPGRKSPRRLGIAALTGALALAAVALVHLARWRQHRDPVAVLPAPRRVQIDAAADARFVQLAGPPHEVIRLYQGTVRFTVAPQRQPGETFRVVTGAGEVEVRGTIFETTAREDRLIAVRVERGRVVVRSEAGQPELALHAGGQWQRPVAALEPAAAAVPAPPPGPRKSAGTPASPTSGPRPTRDPAEQALGEGLALLRAADAAGAAVAFERALTLSPRGTLVEDASYWRAVALTRAGDRGKGHDALAFFLERFPQSARAGEASVMLGWLLLDLGNDQAAGDRLRAGLADPSARVRKSAQAGLDALAAKKAGR